MRWRQPWFLRELDEGPDLRQAKSGNGMGWRGGAESKVIICSVEGVEIVHLWCSAWHSIAQHCTSNFGFLMYAVNTEGIFCVACHPCDCLRKGTSAAQTECTLVGDHRQRGWAGACAGEALLHP